MGRMSTFYTSNSSIILRWNYFQQGRWPWEGFGMTSTISLYIEDGSHVRISIGYE